MEANPPLIFVLNVPAVLLSRAAGTFEITAFEVTVLALVAAVTTGHGLNLYAPI